VAVNGPFDHVTTWPNFQRQYPALVPLDYESVPRGRVLFLKEDRKFVVYMDMALMTTTVKKAVKETFTLPAGQTSFVREAHSHYITDTAELERIFRR
jgi:hypothetical protein